MPITAGDFTPSQLRESVTIADAMWNNEMMRADFVGNVDVHNAIAAEQNARVSIVEDGEKDRTHKIHWINNCANVVEDDDGDDCDLAGGRAGSDSKSYAISKSKVYKFTVNENEFRSNDYSFPQAVAANFLRADKALSEHVAATAVASLETFKGTNEVTTGVGTWNVATTEMDVATADWTERIFAYFYRSAIQNHMPNPFLVSGENLFDDNFIANKSQGNGEGKGTAALFASMRKYYDLFNIDSVNTPKFKSYMINRGAVAFASKNNYGAVPRSYKEQDRYSIASRNIGGLRYDVYYNNKCAGDEIAHNFKLKVHFDYFLNPTGCVSGRTGVLAYNKTA